MPKFHFDTDDGEHFMKDRTGVELGSLEEAAQEAAGLLRDLAHHYQNIGRRTLAAVVRDHKGLPIYRATMTITGALINVQDASGNGIEHRMTAGRA